MSRSLAKNLESNTILVNDINRFRKDTFFYRYCFVSRVMKIFCFLKHNYKRICNKPSLAEVKLHILRIKMTLLMVMLLKLIMMVIKLILVVTLVDDDKTNDNNDDNN